MELIIEETDWEPEEPEKKKSVTDDRIAGVRIGTDEKELQKKVRAAGGKWDSGRKLRIIRYGKVTEMELEDRCIGVIN